MADDADTTIAVNNTIDIVGLDNIKADLKLELGQPFKTESALEIKPLQTAVATDTHLKLEPLKLELQLDPVKIEPLKTDSSLTLDLKPAVIDLCLTANIGKLPSACIRQPYHHHFGFTLYGMEVWGFTVSGQQETVIEELDRQPKVAWGGASTAWPPPRQALPARPAPAPAPSPPSLQGGGLRIRLGS